MTDIPRGDPGVAASTTENFKGRELIVSIQPPLRSRIVTVAVSQTVAYGDLVKVDGATGQWSKLVAADTKAQGVMAQKVETDASNTARAAVYWSGHFNVDELGYPANTAIDTDAERLAVFDLQPAAGVLPQPMQLLADYNQYDR